MQQIEADSAGRPSHINQGQRAEDGDARGLEQEVIRQGVELTKDGQGLMITWRALPNIRSYNRKKWVATGSSSASAIIIFSYVNLPSPNIIYNGQTYLSSSPENYST